MGRRIATGHASDMVPPHCIVQGARNCDRLGGSDPPDRLHSGGADDGAVQWCVTNSLVYSYSRSRGRAVEQPIRKTVEGRYI